MLYLIICFFIFLILMSLLFYIIFIHFREQYQSRDPKLYQIKERLLLLSPQVNQLQFFEDDKSYTINKKKIYLCLKDENNRYYNMNMLMYVAIHELAHVLCNEIGHTDKFHNIFDNLLKKAVKLKIYDPNIPLIHNYCEYSKEKFIMSVH